MPYSDPAKENEKKRRWRLRNPEKQKAHQLAWYEKNREEILTRACQVYAAKWKKPTIDVIGVGRHMEYRASLRERAIKALGGCCRECGFADHRALEFDHIVPIRMKKRGGAGRAHQHVLGLSEPHRVYQLLCANCHSIKTRENGEHMGRIA